MTLNEVALDLVSRASVRRAASERCARRMEALAMRAHSDANAAGSLALPLGDRLVRAGE